MHSLNNSVRELIEAFRTLDAPEDVVKKATAAIDAVVDDLRPFRYDGPYQQAQLRAPAVDSAQPVIVS